MTNSFKVRLAARCEAAGRPENEDNFQIVEDLSISNVGFTSDKIFSLGNKGTLLLVCDGMGGMNAGEVASAVAVKTVKEYFSPNNISPDVLSSDDAILSFVKRAIVKADAEIKREASLDDAKQGMGSTAVLVWLLGQKAYVGWCGDSRIYLYRPSSGLSQMSHDHSYVQDLVDSGKLSPELAFDHPNKNIITRSLGDPRGAAQPDVKAYSIVPGDIIMLCSDGLHDALRDSEIEQTIASHQQSMVDCRDALWNTSRNAGWHDNVTVLVAQIVKDDVIKPVPNAPKPEIVEHPNPQNTPVHEDVVRTPIRKKRIWPILSIVLLLILTFIGAIVFFNKNMSNEKVNTQQRAEQIVAEIKNANSPEACETLVIEFLELKGRVDDSAYNSAKKVIVEDLEDKAFKNSANNVMCKKYAELKDKLMKER